MKGGDREKGVTHETVIKGKTGNSNREEVDYFFFFSFFHVHQMLVGGDEDGST